MQKVIIYNYIIGIERLVIESSIVSLTTTIITITRTTTATTLIADY